MLMNNSFMTSCVYFVYFAVKKINMKKASLLIVLILVAVSCISKKLKKKTGFSFSTGKISPAGISRSRDLR